MGSRRLQARTFGSGLTFRGGLEVIPSFNEWLDRCRGSRKGDTIVLEKYATAPVGAVVWIRHGIRYGSGGHDLGHSQWQCLSRVTASDLIEEGTDTTLPKFRTTLVLIADPEQDGWDR